MAIVPLKKVSFFGITDKKQAVLEDLQRLGCTHLVNLTPGTGDGRPGRGYSVEAHEAFQYLLACPVQRKPAGDAEPFDFTAVQTETLEVRQKEQELSDERDALVKTIEITRPWGEFRLPPESEHLQLRFWFYVVPHYRIDKLDNPDLVWKVVARDERYDYVVVIGPQEPEGVPGSRVKLDSRPLSELTRRLAEIDLELERLHWRRVELTRWCQRIALELARADDKAALDHASLQTLDVSRVFAIQGWVPAKAVEDVERFAHQRNLAILTENPGPGDAPPTLLDNPELFAGGEATVTFYMTPAYNMWDPSIIVFISFAIFFAMIFADAGYALLLAGVLGLTWKKLSTTREAIRMRNLFSAIVLASVVYGILVGSYFGVSPPEDSLLGKLQVLNMQDQGGMMRLSIIVGVIHIALANIVTAWRLRRSLTAVASLGWAAMVVGGLLAGMKVVGDDSLKCDWPVDLVLLIAGASAVLLFSSARPLTLGVKDLVLRFVDGLLSLTNISKAFGDVLSYLRLFALGLASAQLAVTFNGIAGGVAKSPGIGILAAILILIVGHGLNFTLAIIGGVVHGLRLNCIEFFNWSLPEEGYPFETFCKKASH